MFAGVGIIGALASILASVLVPPPKTDEERSDDAADARAVHTELAQIRSELAALRQSLAGPDPPAT
jgi:hypothetical protein